MRASDFLSLSLGAGRREAKRLRNGGVPISAVACDCGDTGTIYLRDRIRQAVGHYAMGRVGGKQYKKNKRKNKKSVLV